LSLILSDTTLPSENDIVASRVVSAPLASLSCDRLEPVKGTLVKPAKSTMTKIATEADPLSEDSPVLALAAPERWR
jgi:hypothetical protein